METTKKKEVKVLLSEFIARYKSQNQAAGALKGVSSATISNIINDKCESIADTMWDNIYRQLTVTSGLWQLHETHTMTELHHVFRDCQEDSDVIWCVGDAGCGKTTAALSYKSSNAFVGYILCSEDMTRTDFITEIAKATGVSVCGLKMRELLDAIDNKVRQMQCPLLIFDESDKLRDPSFHYLITIYNRLKYRAGIVFLSTNYIERRINYGLRYNKLGYSEIWSRIGRRFFEVTRNDNHDIISICKVNGLNDDKIISNIINDVKLKDYDLRRVERLVHKELLRKRETL